MVSWLVCLRSAVHGKSLHQPRPRHRRDLLVSTWETMRQNVRPVTDQILIPQETEIVVASADCALIQSGYYRPESRLPSMPDSLRYLGPRRDHQPAMTS